MHLNVHLQRTKLQLWIIWNDGKLAQMLWSAVRRTMWMQLLFNPLRWARDCLLLAPELCIPEWRWMRPQHQPQPGRKPPLTVTQKPVTGPASTGFPKMGLLVWGLCMRDLVIFGCIAGATDFWKPPDTKRDEGSLFNCITAHTEVCI